MKCSSMKTIKEAIRRPHQVGNFLFVFFHWAATFIRRQDSQVPAGGGVGDHYNIINRSNYSYHFNFPRLFLCVVWFVCFSYEPYFSQIKQLVCGTWEARLKSRPVTTSKGSLSKGKCHSVCLRPCLTPDDREVRLMIGKGNKNTAHLIIVT